MSPVKRRPKPVLSHWYWIGESVDELTRRLNAAGPGARFEVHIDEQQKGTLIVVPAGADAATLDPPINESFVCPGSPLCPH